MIDLRQEEEQQTRAYGPIPVGSIVKVRLSIRKPDYAADHDPMVAKTKSGLFQLRTEFEVISGTYTGLKIWETVSLPASAQEIGLSEGQHTNCKISGRMLRAIIEAAKGIDPKDDSEKANRACAIGSWMDLHGLEFPVCVGIADEQVESKGRFYWNNTISRIVTVNMADYHEVMRGGEVITDGPVVGKGKPKGNNGSMGHGTDPGYEQAPTSAYAADVPF